MSDWIHRAVGIDAPKERSSAQYSNAYRHRIDLSTDLKNILFVKGSWSSSDGKTHELPFLDMEKHFFYDSKSNFFRSFACNRFFGGADCYGCNQQYKAKDTRVNIRNVKLWPVIHLDWYWRDSSKVQYDEPVFYVQPETRAQEREFENSEFHEKCFGKPGFIELGKAHQKHFTDIMMKVLGQCVGCIDHDHEKNGKIEIVGWGCKRCGGSLEDIETTGLGRDAWKAYGQKPKECPHCGHRDYPAEKVGCSQCPTPIRTEIYDVVLPLVKQGGQGKDTSIGLDLVEGEITYIDDYDLPDGSPLLERLDGEDRVFAPQIQAIYNAPDFKEIFAVECTEEYQKEQVFNRKG